MAAPNQDSSIKKDELIKTIIIKTMVPFSLPFSFRMIELNIDNNIIDVDFETAKRDDIIKQFFQQFPFNLYINKRKLPNNQAEVFKQIDNDRFGQLNYMFATFYFYVSEQNKDDIKKAVDEKYLPLCADAINHISKAYRLLVNQYFPRNFTKNDLMGYFLAFSKNMNDFFDEEFYPNVKFHDRYPDDDLRIDINDFLRYEEKIWLHTELIINAEDFFMEKNFRMCFIEADTAIETILSHILQKHYNTFPQNIQNEVSPNQRLEMRISDLNKYLKYVSTTITSGAEWSDKCIL